MFQTELENILRQRLRMERDERLRRSATTTASSSNSQAPPVASQTSTSESQSPPVPGSTQTSPANPQSPPDDFRPPPPPGSAQPPPANPQTPSGSSQPPPPNPGNTQTPLNNFQSFPTSPASINEYLQKTIDTLNSIKATIPPSGTPKAHRRTTTSPKEGSRLYHSNLKKAAINSLPPDQKRGWNVSLQTTLILNYELK